MSVFPTDHGWWLLSLALSILYSCADGWRFSICVIRQIFCGLPAAFLPSLPCIFRHSVHGFACRSARTLMRVQHISVFSSCCIPAFRTASVTWLRRDGPIWSFGCNGRGTHPTHCKRWPWFCASDVDITTDVAW